jgi:hypothetical protein
LTGGSTDLEAEPIGELRGRDDRFAPVAAELKLGHPGNAASVVNQTVLQLFVTAWAD